MLLSDFNDLQYGTPIAILVNQQLNINFKIGVNKMGERIFTIRCKQDAKSRWVTLEEFEDLQDAMEALKEYKKHLIDFKHIILDEGY